VPRDSNGNYTLPAGNPVVPGTVIEAAWANPTMSDIGTAITDSLSRSGQGGMLVPFKNSDGTMAAPGITWANESSSGWYRKANNEFWYSVGNEDIFQITKNGIALASGKTSTNISSYILVQTTEPSAQPKGAQWYDDDEGGLYMRYQNPDLTYTWIAVNATGGDYVPTSEKGVANGVATLDANGQVPASQLLNLYPVGSIYLSLTATNPGTIFGGTWSAIAAGRMLIGVGTLDSDVYVAGETGGLATVTLDVDQIPPHSHFLGGAPGAVGVGSVNSGNDQTAATTVTGGGLAHENRPPYLAVYMFQRTA
jgi:hypothetical protein